MDERQRRVHLTTTNWWEPTAARGRAVAAKAADDTLILSPVRETNPFKERLHLAHEMAVGRTSS